MSEEAFLPTPEMSPWFHTLDQIIDGANLPPILHSIMDQLVQLLLHGAHLHGPFG